MLSFAGAMGLKRPHLRRRAAMMLGSLLAFGLFSAAAVGFLGLGLYLSLAAYVPPVYAALGVGLIGGLLAAVSFSVLTLATRRAERAAKRAVEASALATLAPPLLALAVRHSGTLAAVTVAGAVFMALRRR
ncbi:hypothetical protein VZ95_03070 [Elstera litoralis]|uniref:Uncharacterized protein n=1 Tax=Elstera litoralis TaxID=552518 RepID=A0A0F3IYP1_9PROT|nr:hypothetical protein [Elstera litoralis]KJV10714.1 hypothetical protein VZ95_03070 [Elstera litoralis]